MFGTHHQRRLGLTLVLLAAFISGSCNSSDRTDLVVLLTTDYRAGVDYSFVEVELLDSGATMTGRSAGPADLTPLRVASFTSLPPSSARRVAVSLIGFDGAPVTTRTVAFTQTQNFTVSVAVFRSCRDVACPGTGDAAAATECFDGQCVDPRCVQGTEPECGVVERCGVDDECAAPRADCAAAVCLGGTCFVRAMDEDCAAEQRCDLDEGCLPILPEPDAGVPDAGAMDVGEVDTGSDVGPDGSDVGEPDAGPVAWVSDLRPRRRVFCGRGEEEFTDSSRVSFGDTTIYVGYTEAGGPTQNPVFVRFDSGVEVYCVQHETQAPAVIAEGVTWDGGPYAYVVYTANGGGTAVEGRGGWISSYAPGSLHGGGPRASLLARVAVADGALVTATFVVAALPDGRVNSHVPDAAAIVLPDGSVEFRGSSFSSPIDADRRTSMTCTGASPYTTTYRFSEDLSTLLCASGSPCASARPCP